MFTNNDQLICDQKHIQLSVLISKTLPSKNQASLYKTLSSLNFHLLPLGFIKEGEYHKKMHFFHWNLQKPPF